MDGEEDDSQATQQATQAIVDPRRLGKQNSGFTDEEIADIICILYPKSDNARREVAAFAKDSSKHLIATVGAGSRDYFLEDDPSKFGLAASVASGEQAIVLRLSAETKDPLQGFTFGRDPNRCDFCFANDPMRRLSKMHFRIFLNEYGVLMLEDTSTNGTIVDNTMLQNAKQDRHETKRTLSNGSQVSVLLHTSSNDLEFLVHVPRREGEYDSAFRRNLQLHRNRIQAIENENAQTIRPGADGPVNLFPRNFQAGQQQHTAPIELPREPSDEPEEHLPREWHGSEEYIRVGQIGKGAFATVHKVTSRYNGKPYAAKELDKRRFIKNGVLDQKVENEMKIMRSVAHPNIVRYINHFEWDNRLLIIVMEYVPLGDLGGYVQRYGPLTEKLATTVATQLVGALGYLHEQSITHRDVKPDNILIDSRDPFNVKLTDFGLSKVIDDQTFLRTFCGTLLYCAPEVYSEYGDYDEFGIRQPRRRLDRPPGGQRYDHAVDLWSLGGVIYYTLTGQPPFPVRSGASYAELLHQIMTQPLNVEPLRAVRLSAKGIDCLSWMLHRRPESRATVQEVQTHPWLRAENSTSRGGSAEELGPLASQLSLKDSGQEPQEPQSDDEILDDDEDFMDLVSGVNGGGGGSSGDWPPDENQTFGRPGTAVPGPGPRLFGEVNVSAIGSSGAIAEGRLNLPEGESPSISAEMGESFEESQIVDTSDLQIRPQHHQRRPGPMALRRAMAQNRSAVDSNSTNVTFSLSSSESKFGIGDTGSILQRPQAQALMPRSENEFNSSKRKPPAYDTSDEMGSSGSSYRKPSFKRLRSEASLVDYAGDSQLPLNAGDDEPRADDGDASHVSGAADADDDENDDPENMLVASVPPISRMQSGRQMDNPVSKTMFWQANDRKTWHLDYPEMTQLQLDAFESAAYTTGEDFVPGSPLFDLAMKYFPSGRLNQEAASMPPPPLPPYSDGSGSRHPTPDAASPASARDASAGGVIVPVPGDENRIVATLESTPDSVVQGVSVLVREALTSFGRADDNTQVHPRRAEVKVPKYAFKLLLWKPGFEAWRQFRPWSRRNGSGGADKPAKPSKAAVQGEEEGEEENSSLHFYISTKATNGIRINDVPLQSHDCKNSASPSRHWVRLHDGDSVVIWGDAKQQARLLFRCTWGGSARPRRGTSAGRKASVSSASTVSTGATELEPDDVAAGIDDACGRAERRFPQLVQDDRLNAAAARDYVQRLRTVEVERRRSRDFEARRREACRAVGVVDREAAASAPPPSREDGGSMTPTAAAAVTQPVFPANRRARGVAGWFPNRSASPEGAAADLGISAGLGSRPTGLRAQP